MMRPGIRLHVDFRFVARLDVAQFVLPEEGDDPRVVLLDEAHHRHGRELRRAHAGTQREIRHAAIGRREMRRVPSRSYFALARSASDFAICALAAATSSISPVALRAASFCFTCDSVASAARNSLSRLPRSDCACSRSARLPAPVAASWVNCSTRFFARSIRGVERGLFRRGVLELILQPALGGLGGDELRPCSARASPPRLSPRARTAPGPS